MKVTMSRTDGSLAGKHPRLLCIYLATIVAELFSIISPVPLLLPS